mmetsp:Transcript_51810/g.110042  ORF Transcript_51810/g.110042 Transcript_51810/m.110042 type:complete len:110 (-) Transcript_51810:807-1136(-)
MESAHLGPHLGAPTTGRYLAQEAQESVAREVRESVAQEVQESVALDMQESVAQQVQELAGLDRHSIGERVSGLQEQLGHRLLSSLGCGQGRTHQIGWAFRLKLMVLVSG